MPRRKVDIAIISDVHLGAQGCHADELVDYLRSIQPGALILNGDIVDIWQLSKRYWPRSHMRVIEEIVGFVADDIPVYYLTGNHDDFLRRFSDFSLGNFHLRDKLLLELDGKRHWIFHGDVFDAAIHQTRWLAHLGSRGYGFLIRINRGVNHVLTAIGRPRRSFAGRIKRSVKRAVQAVSDFELTATELAIEQGYDYVVCGHTHLPCHREVRCEAGSATYLNSGDWMEHLTALEYVDGAWQFYRHAQATGRQVRVETLELTRFKPTADLEAVAMASFESLDLHIQTHCFEAGHRRAS